MMTQNKSKRFTSRAGRFAALTGPIALATALLLGLLWVADGLADEKVTVAFAEAGYAVDIPYGQEVELPLMLTLSPTHTADVTVNYEVTSSDATGDDVDPFGPATLVIPPDSSSATIILNFKDNRNWLEGTKTITVELKSVEPADHVELGEIRTATVTIHRIYRTPLPAIQRDEAWKLTEVDEPQSGVRSLAICPTDVDIRYLGSDSGLFQWQIDQAGKGKWKQVEAQNRANVPGSVREITFGESCDEVYAAIPESGVWQRTKSGQTWNWSLIAPDNSLGDALLTSRTVVVRSDHLYVGTDTGIYAYDPDPDADESWQYVYQGKVISRLTLAGQRIYAGVWTEGVAYNDSCSATCNWEEIPGPDGDSFVREVIGPPPDGANPPAWLIFATASTVWYCDNCGPSEGWKLPEPLSRPQPAGNVFSLAQYGNRYYAGVENGGVWDTDDEGRTWKRVGNLAATVRDIAVVDAEFGGIFAATFDKGVWR